MTEAPPTIDATLAHKTILLTGATGFAIIEKFLRTVPSIQQSCSAIECHVHVSTAFVNTNQRDGDSTVVQEKLYPLGFDVEEALAAVTNCASPNELQSLQDKLMGSYANTYALTKAMTEHLVVQRRPSTLPLVILRPSVIGATWQDPMPGFIDQAAGVPMMFLAIGVGVASLMVGDETNVVDMVPLDLFVHTSLASIAHALKSKPTDPFILHVGIAVQANCVGALHTLELVNSCSSLECNANQRNGDSTIVEEELYPLDLDVEEAVTAVTLCTSPDEVQTHQDKLMGSFPNTYTLTKAMTEHLVVQRMRPTVPLVILRPSIIGATWQDPMPGFIGQVGGAPTIYLASGMGVVSLMALDETKVVDMVPLDFVVHTALASIAHALVVKQTTPFIIHAGTSDPRAKPTDYAQPTRAAVEYFQQHPPKRVIFKTSYHAIASPTLFRMAWGLAYELLLRVLSTVAALSHIPWLQKQAAKLQKLTDRAQKIVDTFRPVTNHEWIFHADNAVLLRERFKSAREDWWLDVRDLDWDRWMRQKCMGLKKYILKEDGIEIEIIAPGA